MNIYMYIYMYVPPTGNVPPPMGNAPSNGKRPPPNGKRPLPINVPPQRGKPWDLQVPRWDL